tara:strand:- start:50 stop:337 length:288 start_codon:yes stop_codon:yes gene_type:complete
MIFNKIEAINILNPNAKATLKADGTLVWHENPTNITDEQISTKLAELQADYDAKEYQRKREKEYPSLQDCIHAILDDDLDNLQALRQAVKEKYPK